jgi:hypothetical protein
MSDPERSVKHFTSEVVVKVERRRDSPNWIVNITLPSGKHLHHETDSLITVSRLIFAPLKEVDLDTSLHT